MAMVLCCSSRTANEFNCNYNQVSSETRLRFYMFNTIKKYTFVILTHVHLFAVHMMESLSFDLIELIFVLVNITQSIYHLPFFFTVLITSSG